MEANPGVHISRTENCILSGPDLKKILVGKILADLPGSHNKKTWLGTGESDGEVGLIDGVQFQTNLEAKISALVRG